jgi:hypothetical protein
VKQQIDGQQRRAHEVNAIPLAPPQFAIYATVAAKAVDTPISEHPLTDSDACVSHSFSVLHAFIAEVITETKANAPQSAAAPLYDTSKKVIDSVEKMSAIMANAMASIA